MANIPYSKRKDSKGRRHTEKVVRGTPLLENVIEYVQNEVENPSDLVFGIERWKKNGYHLAWRAVRALPIEDTTIEGENLSFHVFRHTRATKIADKKGSPWQLKETMGWKNIQTAMKYVAGSEVSTEDLADKRGD